MNMEGKDIVYDDNKPLFADPNLIVPLERYHITAIVIDLTVGCTNSWAFTLMINSILIITLIFSATSSTDPCFA